MNGPSCFERRVSESQLATTATARIMGLREHQQPPSRGAIMPEKKKEGSATKGSVKDQISRVKGGTLFGAMLCRLCLLFCLALSTCLLVVRQYGSGKKTASIIYKPPGVGSDKSFVAIAAHVSVTKKWEEWDACMVQ